MISIAKRILKGLRDFHRRLNLGIPIEATRVERHETPDGPMHVQTPVVIQEAKNENDEAHDYPPGYLERYVKRFGHLPWEPMEE